MTVTSVRDQIGAWFGGPYDASQHSYRRPQVAGLGVVRRSIPKQDDHADYYLAAAAGAAHGSMMIVWVHEGAEQRIAVAGPTSGIKRLTHRCLLQVLVRSTATYAEDAEDYTYGLRDGLIARLRTDRTCGSGGFEVGGFQVGEGAGAQIQWECSAPRTSAGLTKLTGWLTFPVVELVYG